MLGYATNVRMWATANMAWSFTLATLAILLLLANMRLAGKSSLARIPTRGTAEQRTITQPNVFPAHTVRSTKDRVASSGRITSRSTFATIITLEKMTFKGCITVADGVQNKDVPRQSPHRCSCTSPSRSHHLKKGSNTCGKCTTTLTFTAHSLAATA
jgi:hypothetical protein